jgi:hypothetical protein
MTTLQATQNIRKVALWLGHSSLKSTEIYLRGDPTEKLEAIEKALPPELRRGVFQVEDELFAVAFWQKTIWSESLGRFHEIAVPQR